MAKRSGKRSLHNKTANVVLKKSTALPNQSSHRRLKYPPVLATNTPTFLLTRFGTTSLSSTQPSRASSTRAMCYGPPHSTLGCQLLLRHAVPNIATIRKEHLRGRNTGDRTQRLLAQIAASILIVVFTTVLSFFSSLDETWTFCSPYAMFKLC